MNLPKAPGQYSEADQAQLRGALDRADKQNIKAGQAIDRMMFVSPNGTRYYLSVSNAGATVWTAA